MPPHVPRKRRSPPPPSSNEPPKKRVAAGKATTPAAKASATEKSTPRRPIQRPPKPTRTLEDTKAFLAADESDDASDSSDALSSTSSQRANKIQKHSKQESSSEDDSGSASDSSSDAGVDWAAELEKDERSVKDTKASEDMVITLDAIKDVDISLSDRRNGKKRAPSKREKTARSNIHRIHVQSLMMHNLIRNHWCDDTGLQKALVDGLPAGCKKEIERWRRACSSRLKADPGAVENGGPKKSGQPESNKRKRHRDWGADADELPSGPHNPSQSDPTLRLLKVLSAYWKKKFVITAPGIRKRGYKDNKRLARERKGWAGREFDEDVHGERIATKAQFLSLANRCQGSRDVGSQLFTALLRSVGLEARLVASLQPIGFGFNKNEEADPSKKMPDEGEVYQSPEKPDTQKADPVRQAKSNPKGKSTSSTAKPSAGRGQQARSRAGIVDATAQATESDSELSTPPSSDDESVVELGFSDITKPRKKYDRDLPYPAYWTEVISPISNQCIAVDPIVLNVIAYNQDSFVIFEPRGAKADKAKQVMAYVVAFQSDNTAKDVTVRYLKKHIWPGKTKGVRFPVEKVPIHNSKGKIRKHEMYDWFKHIMLLYARPPLKQTAADRLENESDLKPVLATKDSGQGQETETLAWYKSSAEFVLERHLRREEALLPEAVPVKQFQIKAGKGGEEAKTEPVFLREDVVQCRTVESWHKEGREVKDGEQPLKQVPMRAVTTIRKRQIEAAEAQMGGEKMMQGLYAKHQTDWIIPPPIEDGIIPKNAYGNMDVYVPTMVPAGAVHIPLRSTAKICRKLGIDHAEAVTGFEFGNRMAVPILTGVVVAKEHEHAVIDAWELDQEHIRKREAEKQEKANLGMWKRFMTGLRVLERMKQQYGDDGKFDDAAIQNALNDAGKKKPRGKTAQAKTTKSKTKQETNIIDLDSDGDPAPVAAAAAEIKVTEPGGFLRDEDEDVVPQADHDHVDGLIMEGETSDSDDGKSSMTTNKAYQTPVSLAQMAEEHASDGRGSSDSGGHAEKSSRTPLNSGATKRGRGRGRARGAALSSNSRSRKAASTSKSKDMPTPEAMDEDEPPVRVTARRRSGRHEAVKSHYFVDSDSETNTRGTDVEQDTPQKRNRGGTSARGRGRGRGRGSSKTK